MCKENGCVICVHGTKSFVDGSGRQWYHCIAHDWDTLGRNYGYCAWDGNKVTLKKPDIPKVNDTYSHCKHWISDCSCGINADRIPEKDCKGCDDFE